MIWIGVCGLRQEVRFLIEREELSKKSKQRGDSLVRAATDGNFQITKLLYEEGKIDLNSRGENASTALCYCEIKRDDK